MVALRASSLEPISKTIAGCDPWKSPTGGDRRGAGASRRTSGARSSRAGSPLLAALRGCAAIRLPPLGLARRSFLRWALIAMVLVASRASGDPADDKARALELSRAGNRAYKAGELEKAAELVRQAYGLYHKPILLYNLALALDGLGSTEEALSYYEQYLATNPDVKDRAAIERRVANMRSQLAEKQAERDQQQATERAITRRRLLPRRLRENQPDQAGCRWWRSAPALRRRRSGSASGWYRRRGTTRPRRPPVRPQPRRCRIALSYATTANVLFVAGGALAIGGAIWAVLDHRAHHVRVLVGASSALSIGLAWTMP